MIVSVCVDTVACAPRWRRLGFNDCKGSGFSEKHQTAKGKVASHAQPQTPERPASPTPSARAPPMPEHPASPTPFESQPPHPAKAKTLPPRESQNPPTPFESQTLPPRESHFRAHICARQEPAKNPPRTRQAPPSPLRTKKSALPSKEERSKISIGPHRLSGSAKHLGYLSNLRALKQA